MSNLTRFDNNNIELVIDTTNGESFATLNGYHRISGKAKSTISERISKLEAGSENLIKSAEMDTGYGVKLVRLIPENVFQDWIVDDCPELAKQIMKAGTRVFLHGLAGFKYEVVQHKIPQTYAEALLEAGKLALERDKLAAQIEADRHKVAFAEAVQHSDTSIDFNAFAKSIGKGRNKLMAQLRDIGVLMKNSTLPYQKWMDAGYFEVSQEILGNGKLVPFAMITGKGEIWLKQRIDHYDNLTKKVVNSISQGVLDLSIIQSQD